MWYSALYEQQYLRSIYIEHTVLRTANNQTILSIIFSQMVIKKLKVNMFLIMPLSGKSRAYLIHFTWEKIIFLFHGRTKFKMLLMKQFQAILCFISATYCFYALHQAVTELKLIKICLSDKSSVCEALTVLNLICID